MKLKETQISLTMSYNMVSKYIHPVLECTPQPRPVSTVSVPVVW